MSDLTKHEPTLPDDLNPVVVEALAKLIGKITGLVPPPTNYFPPEWYGALRDFYRTVGDVAASNVDAAAPVAPERSALAFPAELTADLREVLGWPNFRCGPVAHLMRAAGADIRPKSEDEQAVVLHWMVKLVLQHGAQWWEIASDELKAMQERIATPEQKP